MSAERSEQIMVRMTPAMKAALLSVSQDEDRTVAQTVRLAIRRYLEGQS